MGKLTAQDIDTTGNTDTLPEGFNKVNLTHSLLESTSSGNGAAIAEDGSMRLLQIVADAPITSRRLIDFVLIFPPCDSAVANELMRGRINSIAIMIVVYKARIKVGLPR